MTPEPTEGNLILAGGCCPRELTRARTASQRIATMSVLKTLRDTVAPELNHLYPSAPTETPEGVEPGWHGREHALHAYFVARLFGASADIRSGDFAVLSPYLPPLTSLEKPFDHTWCCINGVAPVDLALNLRSFGQVPQTRTPIVGEGRNGDWEVHYTDDEAVLDEGFGHGNEIILIEREIHAEVEPVLLKDPTSFLATRAAAASTWSTQFGPAIYAQVTLHCFRCATRTAKSIRRLDREAAFTWIAGQYPNAEDEILSRLASSNRS